MYSEALAEALRSMAPQELGAFILMDRIFPPTQQAVLVKDGRTTSVGGPT